jgi:hypothetical protein
MLKGYSLKPLAKALQELAGRMSDAEAEFTFNSLRNM